MVLSMATDIMVNHGFSQGIMCLCVCLWMCVCVDVGVCVCVRDRCVCVWCGCGRGCVRVCVCGAQRGVISVGEERGKVERSGSQLR